MPFINRFRHNRQLWEISRTTVKSFYSTHAFTVARRQVAAFHHILGLTSA